MADGTRHFAPTMGAKGGRMQHVTGRSQRILDLIDVGLQTPEPDPTFGEVSPRVVPGCVRCRRPADSGDFCEGCRAFMLGDSDDDPADARSFAAVLTPEQVEAMAAWAQPLLAAAAAAARSLEEIWRSVTAAMSADITPLVEAIERMEEQSPSIVARRRHGLAAWCPRHGETRGGTCMRLRQGALNAPTMGSPPCADVPIHQPA